MNRRVVLFSPGLTEAGGAQQRSRLIATTLAERGWDVRAITRAGSLNRFRLRRKGNLTAVEIPGFGRRRLGGLLYLLGAIPLGLLWGSRATALASLQLMSTSSSAAICGLVCRKPFIAMATISGQISEIAYLRSTRTWPLRRRLLGRATHLVAQTSEAAKELEGIPGRRHLVTLPNPVELPEAVPELSGERRALFLGRLVHQKNLLTLMDAWKAVVQRVPDAKLTLGGSGDAHGSVESELRARIAGDPILRASVEAPGWVADAGSLLRAHDVFVLPSVAEGMSNALLEACAQGRVVAASDIVPNRTVLGEDYPLLFSPTDTEAISVALTQALTDEGVRKRARAIIGERIPDFSSETVVDRLEGLLNAAGSARS
jgi:L-malate glycosyltransferase